MPTTCEEWLSSLARDRRWLCGDSLSVAADRFKMIIVLHQWSDGAWSHPILFGKGPACAGLVLCRGHYRLVNPGAKQLPTSWMGGVKYSAGMVARGGGWLPSSSSASSKRTPSCFSVVASCLSGKRRATTEECKSLPGATWLLRTRALTRTSGSLPGRLLLLATGRLLTLRVDGSLQFRSSLRCLRWLMARRGCKTHWLRIYGDCSPRRRQTTGPTG